jgi:hypothetical protein
MPAAVVKRTAACEESGKGRGVIVLLPAFEGIPGDGLILAVGEFERHAWCGRDAFLILTLLAVPCFVLSILSLPILEPMLMRRLLLSERRARGDAQPDKDKRQDASQASRSRRRPAAFH